jgi:hypothetical protein
MYSEEVEKIEIQTVTERKRKIFLLIRSLPSNFFGTIYFILLILFCLCELFYYFFGGGYEYTSTAVATH